MNITSLPDHVKKAIELSLKRGKTVVGNGVSITAGDTLRGAGVLSIHRAWKHQNMDRVLSHLAPGTVAINWVGKLNGRTRVRLNGS